MDIKIELNKLTNKKIVWKKTTRDGLDVDYSVFLPNKLADSLLKDLEQSIEYPEISKVRIFGKWHNIPRQQIAFGDPGTTYKFSGVTVPAQPWPETLQTLKNTLFQITGHDFNFVLINRYRNGNDHMGEHRDDEADLDRNAPIASLSLGEPRHFIFKHADARKKGTQKKNIPTVKLLLAHGSLLMMNPPTNNFWYHSLPPRKNVTGIRINLTFRCIINKTKKS